jgi:hypothetical protein
VFVEPREFISDLLEDEVVELGFRGGVVGEEGEGEGPIQQVGQGDEG